MGGNTSPGGDCLFNPLSCWRIRYTIPRPKFIEYQYPSEPKIRVQGERYTIENIPGKKVATYAMTGYVIISGYWRPGWGTGNWSYGIYMLFNPYYASQPPSFRGEFLGWEWGSPMGDNGNALWIYAQIKVNYRDTNNNLAYLYLYPYYSINQIYVEGGTPQTRELYQLNLNPSDEVTITPDRCRFRIFDSSDNIIVDITRDVCPTVQEIACTNDGEILKDIFITPKDRAILGLMLPRLRISSYSKDGALCRKAELIFIFVTGSAEYSRTILDICSPKGCQVEPFLEYNCDDDCGCERCPDEACFACLDGEEICCYGESGTVIKRFDARKKCDDVEVC